MKSPEQLINNIIGQLQGVKKMLNKKEDCFKILNQIKAARSALGSCAFKILETNFSDCINAKKATDKEKLKKILQEVIKK